MTGDIATGMASAQVIRAVLAKVWDGLVVYVPFMENTFGGAAYRSGGVASFYSDLECGEVAL